MSIRKSEGEAVPSYSRLASIYDYVMRHVDYVHWADYTESLFERHDATPIRLLDLACGTGSLALELRKRAYGISGADGCSEMLDVAREKARVSGYEIPFYHKNLLDLSGLPRFEGVLCLYDSLNYLMTLEDISCALVQIHQVVEPGGIFIFDVCTEHNSQQYFRDMTDRDRGDGFSYVRRSTYKNGVQYNRFEIQFTNSMEVVQEVHRQRIYPLAEIVQVLEDSSFQVEGAYDGFSSVRPSENSDRVHFVLRA
ncbi:MAG: class I SAM-dependent methyltransferase [bacterium]|nr:class I SAM-dependent methyltransferase [bacterium]